MDLVRYLSVRRGWGDPVDGDQGTAQRAQHAALHRRQVLIDWRLHRDRGERGIRCPGGRLAVDEHRLPDTETIAVAETAATASSPAVHEGAVPR
jgi:hypothetical protein